MRADEHSAGRATTVIHFGPDLDEPGGMAEVIRCYLDADLAPWSAEFVSTYTTVSRPRQLVLLVRALAALARRQRRSTGGVHLHTSNGFDLVRTLLLLQVARRRALPTVVTIHGSRFMTEVQRAPRLVRAILRRAGAVTVLTDDVHDAAVALGAERIRLLQNPVRTRPQATGGAGELQVVFAGEIGRRKGVDVLLAAWAEVHASHPEASLLLLGPVADASLVSSLPPGSRLGGALPHDAVLAALDTATLAVLPSRAEAMPMFVLEAMASGVPVVATAVGSVATVLGEAGVIVPVGDAAALAAALADLLGDPARRRAMGERGRAQVAERFSFEIFRTNVVSLYDTVFAR